MSIRTKVIRFAAVCFALPAMFVLVLNLSFLLPAPAPSSDREPVVGYFAYGSNMNDRYFARIRGIERNSSEAAILPDHKVAFNLNGIPNLEPAFANLAPEKGATAYGIFHRLPEGELEKIIGSEGDNYAVRDVTVYLNDGSTTVAKTLISKPSLEVPVVPSRRYLGYMHEAAIDYGMPAHVIERYDPDQGAYIPVVSEAFGATMQTAVWVFARK